jgi:hypothetical protein
METLPHDPPLAKCQGGMNSIGRLHWLQSLARRKVCASQARILLGATTVAGKPSAQGRACHENTNCLCGVFAFSLLARRASADAFSDLASLPSFIAMPE